MVKKLYRKLYLYAIVIVASSIFLTAIIISTFFQSNELKMFKQHSLREVDFIQQILTQNSLDSSEKIYEKMDKISKKLNWDISYWKDSKLEHQTSNNINLPLPNDLKKLDETKKVVILHDKPPEFITYLDANDTSKGYIIVRFNFLRAGLKRPFRLISTPITFILLILAFLALLLIPYSLYIVKPFKELILSINRISQGDFSATIELPKNNEFKELADAFNNMIKKIQEMIAQKQRLIADVSHELRSPLTRMRLGLEILSKDPEGRRKYIDKSIAEIEQLDKLIGDVLNVSKLELQENSFNFEKAYLKDIILESIEKNNLLLDQQKISIKTSFPEQQIKLKIDKALIDRALVNIFSNLVKYVPYSSQIDILIKNESKKVILSIRDRGVGVSTDELEKIFEAFFRTDDSRTRKTGGTGLGLSIVKKIVEIHKGKVWASLPNDNENGLIINIELPIYE
ncbi:MAG: HAMP domain-containing protein [Candidatus Sericytochromatia bacterium]|nr:HAMP domain-containing protein [Candidatus Sericytochromatia bacterium]